MLTSYNVKTADFLPTQVEGIESVRGEDAPLRYVLKEGRFIRTSLDGLFLGCTHPVDSLSIFPVLESTRDSTVRSGHLPFPSIRTASSNRSVLDGKGIGPYRSILHRTIVLSDWQLGCRSPPSCRISVDRISQRVDPVFTVLFNAPFSNAIHLVRQVAHQHRGGMDGSIE